MSLRVRERASESSLLIIDGCPSGLRTARLPDYTPSGETDCAPASPTRGHKEVHDETGLQRKDQEVRMEIDLQLIVLGTKIESFCG